MEKFSNLVLELYRAVNFIAYEDFQKHALQLVESLVQFDSAIWSVVSFSGDTPVINHVQLHDKTSTHIVSMEVIQCWLPLLQLCLESPGHTFVASAMDPTMSLELRNSTGQYGIAHAAATSLAHDLSGTFTFISIFRRNPAQTYIESDRLLIQSIMPHLIETESRSRIRHMGLTTCVRSERILSLAVTDKTGILYSAEPGFLELIRLEWAHWQGPELPSPMLARLAINVESHYCGSEIVIEPFPTNKLIFLKARRRNAVDRLSQREASIARLFADGCTYKEIALELRISPATVRSHLGAAYMKLDITNKAELVNVLRHAFPSVDSTRVSHEQSTTTKSK